MKILNEGQIPTPAAPWWDGEVITCSHCNAKFELEKGDKVQETTDRRPHGKTLLNVECPTCHKPLTRTYRITTKDGKPNVEFLS